ncbi:MAG: hypothetical protein PVI57_02860 [Gemmatimonadota bacterium]|jgi:hypothetical protein
MERAWTDELGREWLVEVEVPDVSPDLEVDVGDTTLVFSGEAVEPRSIDVLGPMEELFGDLGDQALQHALDAAGTGFGILLVDAEGNVWWVRGPDAELRSGRWAVKFSDGEDELTHEGPLDDDPVLLGEDELLELLDDARGRLMDPLDLRV